MNGNKSYHKQDIVALIPTYIKMKGDGTKILTENTGEYYEQKNIKRVLIYLAKKQMLDLRECKRYYGEKLGCKNLIPIPLNKNTILIPVKTRSAINKNDSAFSYINLNHIAEILSDNRNGVLILKDKREIITRQRKVTIEKHITNGKLIQELLEINDSTKIMERDLFEEYNAPATRGDLIAMKNDIMYTISRLNTWYNRKQRRDILIELKGNIDEIIFHNEDNGYTVAILETDDNIITIVGNIPLIREGETLKVAGTKIVHPTYGEQLKVETYELIAPATLVGIERYLSSGLIPGIGPKTAERIVERFGEKSLDILQYDPERLKEIGGIGDKKIKGIAESFREQREIKDTMVFLAQYDITPALGIKIYKRYGSETTSKVKENPYRLSDEIIGVGFKLADNIATSMGVDKLSEYRINAGIKFTLKEVARDGHTYSPKDELIIKSSRLLSADQAVIEEAIMNLALKSELQLETMEDHIAVYHMPYYFAETNVSKKIIELSSADKKDLKLDIEEEINFLEKNNDIELAENQKQAIRESVENGLLIVTGGPGTGKTTTINSIIQLFEDQNFKILLAAPTGRAAKRMSEATGRQSKTIHRLLEYGYADESLGMIFSKDEGAPLEADVVIIDEMSMVDILLMNNLLKAIQPGTRLILVGDIDQLPSVGAGNVLKDMIESELVKVVKLDEIFRQARESMIIVNAHKINHGEIPTVNSKGKDFFFLERNKPKDVLETVLELSRDRLPKWNDYDPVRDIQILSCSRKGDVGVNILNKRLQEYINPKASHKSEKVLGDLIFRVGDKVMQIKNNYNTKWKLIKDDRVVDEGEGVFNGDFGFITEIDKEENELVVVFDDGRQVIYSFNQLDELVLAYATTIHKSQGSEFPVVVLPIFWGPPMLLTRNLLYTAITRAKEIVVLVGDKKCLAYMIDNNKITNRYSGLKSRLAKTLEFVNI